MDTLADVAEYYNRTDLRDTSKSNCTGVPIPPATTGLDVCGSTATADLVQNMVTFTMGLGANGLMQYSTNYYNISTGDYAAIKNANVANPTNGICIWQSSGACT